MNEINVKSSSHFRLKQLTGFLLIGLSVVSNSQATGNNVMAGGIVSGLQANPSAMKKSVQSNFDPDLWQNARQLNSSGNLAADEAIERIRQQFENMGRVTSQSARLPVSTATNANSGYLAEKANNTAKRIKRAIKNLTIDVRSRKKTGSVSQLKGKLLARTELSTAKYLAGLNSQPISREKQDKVLGREFLNAYKGVLQIDNPDQEFELIQRKEDKLKRCHLRYSQVYKGLPVWPAELMVHLDPQGDVDLMSGAYISTPRKLVTKPTLTADEAIDAAIGIVPDGEKAEPPSPELIIYAPVDRTPRLAWKMEFEISLSSRWLAIIDAHTGTKLDAYEQVMDFNVKGIGTDISGISHPLNVWRENNLYYMADSSKPMFNSFNPQHPFSAKGAIMVLDFQNKGSKEKLPESVFHITSSHNNYGWLPDGVSASYGLSETYDYFLERYNRNSIDGKGGNIIGIVRLGDDLANAFWNGRYILFGDKRPLSKAIDVVAHEMTHGITQAEAGLIFQNQSGALNEAFSDIFGEMAEARLKGGSPDWLKGASVFPTPIQNYKQPSLIHCWRNTPCPAKMSQFIHLSADKAGDFGGVHSNSSIINHAFYLLAEGLSGAIGIRDAEQIFYRTLTTKLLPQSQFVDARRGAIVSAEELFGIGSAQAKITAEAFDHVEIFDNVVPPAPDGRPAITAADSTLAIFWGANISDSGEANFGYFIGRKEQIFNDPQQLDPLFPIEVKQRRLSVSGDGSEVAFVSSDNDFCIYQTDNSHIGDCLGFSGQIYSGTMSADGLSFAFILLNDEGEPENKILLVDLANDSSQEVELKAPLLDGNTIEVRQADVMDFSSNGSMLMYDAFSQIQFENGSKTGVWSIYGLDLNTGSISFITYPSPDRDSGNGSFSHTRDYIITFEGARHDSSGSIIIGTKNLLKGESYNVKTVSSSFNMVSPTYTGDDSAIIYSVPEASLANLTGFSLFHQPLADDFVSAKGGSSVWLKKASQGAIYRRGDFKQQEKFSLNVSLAGNGSGLVSSSPAGIICGNDCTEEYVRDTLVSLVANPTTANSFFSGWSGDCSGTGACKITVKANTSVTANFSLKAAPPPSNDIFGNARLFAEQQYRDFLHREGDAGGIEYWRKEIESGRLSRAEVVNNFLSSNEFAGQIAPIVRLYFSYFRRIPDFQGLNYWLDKSQSGMSLKMISESFEQSNEFKETYGRLSNASFVTLVYQNVLRRDPDREGFNYWMSKLTNGKSRGEIMAGFSESAEFRLKTADSVGVTMVYTGMLLRSPDPSGFSYWEEQLGDSASLVDIISGFLDSSEYHNRF